MSLALGLGVAVGVAPAVAAGGGVGANLLLWTEAFDDPAWAQSSVTVTADAAADPNESVTAEQVANAGAGATIAQTSTVPAASGSGLAIVVPGVAWSRHSVTAVFNTGTYTFSLWLRDPGGSGSNVNVRMDVSGGFIRCFIQDSGDTLTYLAWGAKLETGAAATGDAATYGKREGT